MMTEVQQHQEPVKRAEVHAEAAITAALHAEALLDEAVESADPKLMLSSQGRLQQVEHNVLKAQEQLTDVNSEHKYDAQLLQMSDRLNDAQEDVEAAIEDAHMPRRIRSTE